MSSRSCRCSWLNVYMFIFRGGKWAASFQDIPKVFSFHFYWIQALFLIYGIVFRIQSSTPPVSSWAQLCCCSQSCKFQTQFFAQKWKRKRKLAHCCWLPWVDVRDNPGNCPQTLTSCSRSLLLLDRWCLGGSHRDQFWGLLKSTNWTKMNLF